MDLECLEPMERLRSEPKCAKCRNHHEIVPRKGHKNRCPWFNCYCVKCASTTEKREYFARRQKSKRDLKRSSPDQNIHEDVQLLLNLKVNNTDKKIKCPDSIEEPTESKWRTPDYKWKYRFSGTIQNNMFYPAIPNTSAVQPDAVMSPTKQFEAVSPPEESPQSPTVREVQVCSQSCPYCTCSHIERLYPPTQQRQSYTDLEDYQPTSHEPPGPLMSTPNYYPEQWSPVSDIYCEPYQTHYLDSVSQVTVREQPHHSPTPSLRYPFNANVVSQNMINFKFMQR